MISLTSKVAFYENSFDFLKSFANPIQLQIHHFSALLREMKLPKSIVSQHLARLKKADMISEMLSCKELVYKMVCK